MDDCAATTSLPEIRAVSHQQSLDAMRVDHPFTGRPREDSEASILRRDQGQGIALIVYELGSREMPGSAEVFWMDDSSDDPLYGFRYGDLLDPCLPASP